MKFRDYGKGGLHRKSDFERRFDTPYEMQEGKGDDYLFFALANNVPMTNGELLSALGPTIDSLREVARQSDDLTPKDVVVLRLYEALKRTEGAFQGQGEDYEETSSKFYLALRGAEIEGQMESIFFLRSILNKMVRHECGCNYCIGNRELAAGALRFLSQIERATGMSGKKSDAAFRRGDGTDINEPKKPAGSMFLAG